MPRPGWDRSQSTACTVLPGRSRSWRAVRTMTRPCAPGCAPGSRRQGTRHLPQRAGSAPRSPARNATSSRPWTRPAARHGRARACARAICATRHSRHRMTPQTCSRRRPDSRPPSWPPQPAVSRWSLDGAVGRLAGARYARPVRPPPSASCGTWRTCLRRRVPEIGPECCASATCWPFGRRVHRPHGRRRHWRPGEPMPWPPSWPQRSAREPGNTVTNPRAVRPPPGSAPPCSSTAASPAEPRPVTLSP